MVWMVNGRTCTKTLNGEFCFMPRVFGGNSLTLLRSHESNTSFLDNEEEGWCLKIPYVVPEEERTDNWP